METIVVDNASTDDTATMLAQVFPAVSVVYNSQNEGFARGNNAGLAVAEGRYLMLLNSDTEVRPGALAELVRFMDENPRCGACGPMLLNMDGSLQPSGRDLPTFWNVLIDMTKVYRLWKDDLYRQVGRDYSRPCEVGEISGAALLVRREVYEQVGGLDPAFFAYYEDVDWCKRIRSAGWRIYYVPDAKVTHLWQGTSRQVSALAYRAGQHSLRYYFAKHHGLPAQGGVTILLVVKEIALIGAAFLRGHLTNAEFHVQMLANLFRPFRLRP